MHKLNADEFLENYVKRNNPKRSQLQQMEYRMPNSRTRAKVMAARFAEKLLVISHYEQDVYHEQLVQRADGSMVKESVKTGQKVHGGMGEIPYLTDHHLQLFLKDLDLDPVTQQPITNVPRLTPYARILTPNPPAAFGLELPEPTYLRLIKIIDGIKSLSVMEEE